MVSVAMDDRSLAEARAKAFVEAIVSADSCKILEGIYDHIVLQGMTNVRSDGPGQCTADLPVTSRVCNWMGNIHGGCTGESRAFMYTSGSV